MSELKIIVNPTESIIAEDMLKCDVPVIIHKKLSKNELREVVKGMLAMKMRPVYIHYYTKSKVFTIGVKKEINNGQGTIQNHK